MSTNFVLFKIGTSVYGIDIKNIVSIEKVSDTTATPQMPEYMVGIVNIREKIMPIIDCKKLLFHENSKINEDSRYILIESNNTAIVLLVESTKEIISFDESLIKPIHMLGTNSAQQFLDGVVLLEERIISVINIEKLLDSIDHLSAQNV